MAERYAETARTHGYQFTTGSGYELPQYPFRAPPEIASGQASHHPVVIVGGGLAGLTAACALAQYGVAAIVLDEDNTVGVKGAASRGICYTQKSLEIFQRLGVYDRIAAKGIQWSVGRTFAGADEVYSFDLRQQSAYNLSSQPPFINIQQFYIEAFLVDRIAELGHVQLRWQNRVTGFAQDGEAATLTVSTPAGDYRLRADHVIDATGCHSPFRKWVGASVTARKGDDRWCIADVRFTRKPPVERHTWIEAPFNENRAVWQHLMGDNVWRIDYQMAPDSDPAEVSREDVVRERLARQFGADAGVEIVWVGPYAYRSECVDAMRHGRVFFMGDSAKVVSPFGARGGNTGISDADNLAWKLAAVIRGHAAPAVLDSYHQERHEAARQNVLVTNRTARFLRPGSPMEKTFRDAALGLARQHLFARQFVDTGRMAVPNPYTESSACGRTGGLSVQNVAFEWADGSRGEVTDLLRWADGRLLLLLFGGVSSAGLARARSLAETAPLCCVQVVASDQRPGAREFVHDPKGHLQGACHVFGHAWALVRPDSYVAATGESVDAALVHAIGQALGAGLQEDAE
ncbi:MAG: pentachlorophenol 4-monooxygenase (Pentachlorophenol hydroxylase)-like protein [Ramlibacter sp.]|jgi:3-(3-hydroxy-phenyl)propionate hydroxylase|uniref:FAD-dependent monooxygenase n=1 Tax=Ramlibacter sp. TaxID=1917967 RepID=UPI0026234EA5|nr:FAD-dependent monooxygenase [Ramlibacter sp.]MDB5753493.1 pentachlorophenol 4-monooxygenase (Pentachlorophenol hydroxylase)-like protein [Ramlibacter sp.]